MKKNKALKKKKSEKQYNKVKGALYYARAGLKDLGVWSDVKNLDYKCEVVNYKTGKSLTPSDVMKTSIANVRYFWNIQLVVVGCESNGKQRIEIASLQSEREYYHDELIPKLKSEHEKLAADFAQKNKVTNLCWLAVPNGVDVNEECIWSLIESRNSW